MESDEDYNDIDRFINEKLFCVSGDLEVLTAEVLLAMDGESDILEIKGNKTNESLRSNAWDRKSDLKKKNISNNPARQNNYKIWIILRYYSKHSIIIVRHKREQRGKIQFSGWKCDTIISSQKFIDQHNQGETMDNASDMTRISRCNKSKIQRFDLSPREVIDFLDHGAIYRTFSDVLTKVYPGNDLQKVLVGQLEEITGKKRDSVTRNVKNWIKGCNEPSRESLFQICFALRLDEQQAYRLLASSSDTGIHYRNPVELIYAFCLKTGRTYKEAQRLKEELIPIYEAERALAKQSEAREEVREQTAVHTLYMKDEFSERVETEEELRAFFIDHGKMLGILHNTAYEEFMKMLGRLQDPDEGFEDDSFDFMKKHKDEFDETSLNRLAEREEGLRKQSIKAVVEEFMQMHVPVRTESKPEKKQAKRQERDYVYLQQAIKDSWPSEDILYKMISRENDVSRKVLLLLFLLTEEFEAEEMETSDMGSGMDDLYFERIESEDGGERMEARLHLMNLFLDRFGMNRLDPGNAFDCLVLYALRASYSGGEGDPMSSRLKQTLELLFPGHGADRNMGMDRNMNVDCNMDADRKTEADI